jgi:glycosyltransferase involved in cell wall biosynthesis
MSPRLIVIGPLPPPYHGVTISTSLVLANKLLHDRFTVEHVDTSDHRANSNVGTWDLENIRLAAAGIGGLARRLRGTSGLVYLPLSQNVPGFVRDALFIHAASARGWKVAAHLRGSDFRTFYRGSPTLFRRWIRMALSQVDSVAVMGSSLRWVFEGLVPSERIEVVANGTPEAEAGLDGVVRDAATVLFLSNLRRRKGVVEAVEAALLVLEHHPTARFLFVGEWESPELEQTLRARAAAAGPRIEFLEARSGEAKDRLLATCSILLFPPREPEGHPRVVLEGLAAGIPVVTTDRGAIAETVVDGESGFILDNPVPEELAEKMLELLRNTDLRERMGEAARNRYLAAFTQEEADRRLADWLWKLAES